VAEEKRQQATQELTGLARTQQNGNNGNNNQQQPP
jgi:hypothetical protein